MFFSHGVTDGVNVPPRYSLWRLVCVRDLRLLLLPHLNKHWNEFFRFLTVGQTAITPSIFPNYSSRHLMPELPNLCDGCVALFPGTSSARQMRLVLCKRSTAGWRRRRMEHSTSALRRSAASNANARSRLCIAGRGGGVWGRAARPVDHLPFGAHPHRQCKRYGEYLLSCGLITIIPG